MAKFGSPLNTQNKEGVLGEFLLGNLEFVNLPRDLPNKERLESLVKLLN